MRPLGNPPAALPMLRQEISAALNLRENTAFFGGDSQDRGADLLVSRIKPKGKSGGSGNCRRLLGSLVRRRIENIDGYDRSYLFDEC